MITLHCGLHKTGSSSIQVALRSVRIRKGNVHLPVSGMDQSEDAWRYRLANLGDNDVLSNENLLGSPFDGYGTAERRAALLKDSLSGRGFQLIWYIRPQLSWLQSVYLQGVQQGSSETAEGFLSRCLMSPSLNWSHLWDVLESTGAQAVVPRAYVPSRNVVSDFLNLCGHGVPTTKQAELRVNTSISPAQAVIMRELNAQSDSAKNEMLRAAFQQGSRRSSVKRQSVFSESRQVEVLQAYAGDWEAVTSRVRVTDALESQQFEQVGARWWDQKAEYVGTSLVAPEVQAEIMDVLTNVIGGSGRTSRPRYRRVASELWRKVIR